MARTCWLIASTGETNFYRHDDKVILDVQQIVPLPDLPEAQDHQVRLREQRGRQREAQRSMRDYTRDDFGDQLNLPKRRLALRVPSKTPYFPICEP